MGSRWRSAALAGLAAAALIPITACGSSAGTSRPTQAELTIALDPGRGSQTETWTVSCPDPARAAACVRLLASPDPFTNPPPDSACTLIYGGPEVLTVTGHLGTRQIRYRTGRTNGCEIADYTRDLALTAPFRAAPATRRGRAA